MGRGSIENIRQARRAYNREYYSRTAIYGRRSWSASEDAMVLAHSITDTELSQIIQRSVRAIQVRRTRLIHSV